MLSSFPIPSAHLPAAHVPSAPAPSAHVPSAPAPSAHIPSAHAPSAHLPSAGSLLDAARATPPVVYLLLATLSLLVALRVLRFLRRASMPLGALLQLATATAVVTVAVGAAILLMAAAAVTSH